jgi:hypothetical protein
MYINKRVRVQTPIIMSYLTIFSIFFPVELKLLDLKILLYRDNTTPSKYSLGLEALVLIKVLVMV